MLNPAKKKVHDLVFLGVKLLSEMVRGTADVIKRGRERERGQVINEREWVSWANAIVILIFENTLRTIHIVPAISTPKSAWRSTTQRAAILWQGPGQARVRVGGTDASRSPRHNAVNSTFPPPMQVANDSAQAVAKTRKCRAPLPRPFYPDLMFAFGLISIDRVYLVCTT